MPADEADFDDALDLAQHDFGRYRLIVFCGESGSGKSSAIRFLLAQHPDFADHPGVRVIEELRHWRDLAVLAQAMRSGHRLLVASHLPTWFHRAMGWLWRSAVFALDAHPIKIRRWMRTRDIICSDAAVDAFCRQFGANYTDAALIVRHFPGRSFDLALRLFDQQCRLHRGEPIPGQPVQVIEGREALMRYEIVRAGSAMPGAE